MASTSTQSIVLPSIHEMFPEHLMPRSTPNPHIPAPSAFPRSRFVVPPHDPHQSFSYVFKSDPRGSSLQHARTSSRLRPFDLPAVRTGRPLSSSGSSDGDAEMMVEGEDGEEGVVEEGKKHVCSTCGKRFNRPSSLRIHVNTHTGATPFRCPHPSCGRAFNVNSNMRRHFRNHANPDFAENASMHSYPSPSSASSPISPTSGPPSATWSVSSADSGSLSPLTPSSSPSSSAAYTYSYSPTPPEPKPQPAAYSAPRLWTPPPTSLSLSPVSTWSSVPASAASTKQRYSESDVRSERR